jgi:hypothetical protein
MIFRRPLIAMCLLLGVGCSNTVAFTVLHPAALDLTEYGNRFSVGPIESGGHDDGAALVASLLRNRIANSANPTVTLAESGAPVVITGTVLQYDYQESISKNEHQCQETRNWVDEQGVQHTDNVNVWCVSVRRDGTAIARVEFSVVRASDRTVLFDNTYWSQDSAWTAVNDSRHWVDPDPIDATGLLSAQAETVVDGFARVILPWSQVVSEPFEKCDGDDRCKQARAQLQAGNFGQAESLLASVVGASEPASAVVPSDAAERVAGALYDLAVVRAYSARFDEARAAVRRAIALQPKREEDWSPLLGRIDGLASDAAKLRSQQSTPASTR